MDNLAQAFLMAPFFVLLEVRILPLPLEFLLNYLAKGFELVKKKNEFGYVVGASNCVWIRAISRVSCNCESEDRY